MGSLAQSSAAQSPVPATATTHVTRSFSVAPEEVFDAWFDPQKLRLWMFEPPWGGALRIRIDARVGGSFSFVERRNGRDVAISGSYLEIDRPRRLVCTWLAPHDSPRPERVAIDVQPSPDGCELRVSHESDRTVTASWTRMLQALAQALGCTRPAAQYN